MDHFMDQVAAKVSAYVKICYHLLCAHLFLRRESLVVACIAYIRRERVNVDSEVTSFKLCTTRKQLLTAEQARDSTHLLPRWTPRVVRLRQAARRCVLLNVFAQCGLATTWFVLERGVAARCCDPNRIRPQTWMVARGRLFILALP
eukprot:1176810-Prorocentrum_minimum.AAC.2